MAQDDNLQLFDINGERINLSALWKYGVHTVKVIATESAHQNIHNEISFECGANAAHGSELANDAAIEILLRVGPGSPVHLVRDVGAGGDFEVEFFRGVTVADPGSTSIDIFNKYGGSSVDSVCTAFKNPTSWSGGEVFPVKFLPGGSGGIDPGGSDGGYSREVVLAAGSDNIFRVTNRSGTAQMCSDVLEWYEPTNPNAP